MTAEDSRAGEKSRESGPDIVTARFRESWGRILDQLPPGTDQETQKQKLLTLLELRAEEVFPELKAKFDDFFASLREESFSSREEMLDAVASRASAMLVSTLSLTELETRFRESAIADSGWVHVNEAVSYGIEDDTQSLVHHGLQQTDVAISLHIPINLTRTPFAELELFIKGLRHIAKDLQTKPELEKITNVIGDSWIVRSNPGLLNRLGFSIGPTYEAVGRTTAIMSRNDFIKRYG